MIRAVEYLSRPLGLLAITAVGIAFFAGCGSDSDGDSGAGSEGTTIETSSLTKAQFIKRADQICDQVSEDLLGPIYSYMKRHASKSKSEEELTAEAVRKVVVPQVEAEIEEIRALGAPAGDEEQIEEFLIADQRSVDSLKARRQLSLVPDVDNAFKQSKTLARAYGLKSCV